MPFSLNWHIIHLYLGGTSSQASVQLKYPVMSIMMMETHLLSWMGGVLFTGQQSLTDYVSFFKEILLETPLFSSPLNTSLLRGISTGLQFDVSVCYPTNKLRKHILRRSLSKAFKSFNDCMSYLQISALTPALDVHCYLLKWYWRAPNTQTYPTNQVWLLNTATVVSFCVNWTKTQPFVLPFSPTEMIKIPLFRVLSSEWFGLITSQTQVINRNIDPIAAHNWSQQFSTPDRSQLQLIFSLITGLPFAFQQLKQWKF